MNHQFYAPCGHVGEPIIGTFVRCLAGCDSKMKSTGSGRRGSPGHVVDCACKPCQIHRSVTTIVLRSALGEDMARIPWDGVTLVPRGRVTTPGSVRGWRMLDTDGSIVAENTAGGYLSRGDVEVEIKTMMDEAAAVALSFTCYPEKSLRQAAKAMNFGLPPGGGTAHDIEYAVLMVPCVNYARTSTGALPGHFVVDVVAGEAVRFDDVRSAIDRTRCAGSQYTIHWNHPEFVVRSLFEYTFKKWADKKVRLLDAKMGIFSEMEEKLKEYFPKRALYQSVAWEAHGISIGASFAVLIDDVVYSCRVAP